MPEYQQLELVTPPTGNAISVSSVKDYLRLESDVTDEDALLKNIAAAATSFIEGRNGYTGRALLHQTWKVFYRSFSEKLVLPFPPLVSVTSVKYRDTDDAEQTLAAAVYSATKTEPSTVILNTNQSWPDTFIREDAVTIEYKCGYSADADHTTLPGAITAALLLVVGDLYQNREGQNLVSGAKYEANPTVLALLDQYRINYGF